MPQSVRKAVIPAAGFGTRFLPIAKAVPKEMLPIVDKPVIQYVVEEAVESGITEIIIIISRSKRPIEEHFAANPELDHELERRQHRFVRYADDYNIYVASERAGKREAKRDGLPPAKTKAQGE